MGPVAPSLDPGTNWGGNLRYAARELLRPESLDDLPALVRSHPRIRVLGTRHSFSPVADTPGVLVSLSAIPMDPDHDVVVDREAMTATLPAWATYAQAAPVLHRHGVALSAMASLPHLGVAGACATATHGSGLRAQVLPASVVAMSLVDGRGEQVQVSRGSTPDFPGYAVHLGALGVVTSVTLAVEPALPYRQSVFVDLPRAALDQDLLAVLGAGDSVSLFTRWLEETVEAVFVKSRGPLESPVLEGTAAAHAPYHPIRGADPGAVTVQLGQPGPWHERLPHFRADRVPSNGAEIQSEWFVALSDAADALDAVWALGPELADVLLVSEVRTVAADDLWLSPARDRDLVALHFTWRRDAEAVARAARLVEQALAPWSPLPHWGKVSASGPAAWRGLPGVAQFAELVGRHDPQGRFRNATLDALLGADGERRR